MARHSPDLSQGESVSSMHPSGKSLPQLEFSEKYSDTHAQSYFDKHEQGVGRRLSNWREQNIARKALRMAGNPASVLDLPCGTGRFWKLLADDPARRIYAADYNQPMLDVAIGRRPRALTGRIETFQCSAFDIPKADNFVDSVFCMRLMHHIGKPDDRLAILRELRRVASASVIISLWVDGNVKAFKRRRLEARRERGNQGIGYQNRFVLPRATVEREFQQAGLKIAGHVDLLKFYSFWRIYVLKP